MHKRHINCSLDQSRYSKSLAVQDTFGRFIWTHSALSHNMFSPTQPLGKALRRLRLTTKMTNKGYYKGNRSGRMGSHTKWGGYVIDPALVRTYKVPTDLAGFEVISCSEVSKLGAMT